MSHVDISIRAGQLALFIVSVALLAVGRANYPFAVECKQTPHSLQFCRVVGQSATSPSNGILPSNWTDLSCQRFKLVGKRRHHCASHCELALADHLHELDAREHITGASE